MKQKLIFLGLALLLLNWHARTVPKAQEQLIRVNGADIFLKVIGKGEPIAILHGGPGLGHNYLFHPFSQLTSMDTWGLKGNKRKTPIPYKGDWFW